MSDLKKISYPKVENINFNELKELELVIPPYQRAYTWGYQHIDKLIEDFEDFFKQNNQKRYYMGTILLHKSDKKYNIIDGQQRITTLILIAIILEIENIKDIVYDNHLSHYKIKENYDYISQKDKIQSLKEIFEKLSFTLIITDNVDDAFIFFDTQNSRGVQPSVLVLIKTFNLRVIESNRIQKESAKEWDNYERDITHNLAEVSEKLEWLIKIFFYRVRNWRGNKAQHFGSYISFRDTFTKELRIAHKDGYKLYTSVKNIKIVNQDYEIVKKVKNIDWFEFSARQPIYQGEGFFQFLSYYSDLLDELMLIEVHHNKTFKYLLEVHKKGSVYMESFLTMITLTYYDRFAKENLTEFIKLLNNILTQIRINSSRILKQTFEKQLIRCENGNTKENIIDMISSAFDSQEVIEKLEKNISYNNVEKLDGIRKTFYEKNQKFWGDDNE